MWCGRQTAFHTTWSARFIGAADYISSKPHFMHSLGHLADAFLLTYKPLGPILDIGPPGLAPPKPYGFLLRWLVLAV